MKYFIIAFCLLLIALAVVMFIKFIKKSSEGCCCGNCRNCSMNGRSSCCSKNNSKSTNNL
ncbi:MAG: hypothetical protein ACI4RC_03080 [Oscillospiraceae bacterium]